MSNLAEDRLNICFDIIDSFPKFVSNHCHIEDKESNQAIPFDLWPSQQEVIKHFEGDDWLVILKARQLGLTWMVACYCLWLAITRPLQQILVISYNEEIAKEFVGRIRFVLARLEEWKYPRITRDTTEFLGFEHKEIDTGLEVNSLIQSLPSTPKGGQSKTPTLLVIDESAWNQYFKEIYTATEPGIAVAKGRIIVVSNAMKRAPGWPFTRELFTNAMRGKNQFKHVFMPWWDHPDRPTDLIEDPETKENIKRFIYIEKYQKNKHDDDISEHYPGTAEEAISAITGSYFGKTLQRHSGALIKLQDKGFKGVVGDLAKNPKSGDIEFTENPRGLVEIWRFPYHLTQSWRGDWWTRMYGIGSDVSEGLGLSYSVAYVRDRRLDELVCRIRSNRIDAHSWADLIKLVADYYTSAVQYTESGLTYESALICVERTGPGQTTVDRLQDKGARQYVEEIPGSIGAQITKRLGWTETEQKKHDLSEDLRNWYRHMKGTLYCPILIDESSTWIQFEGTRRLGPEPGKFGDCVIAAGLTDQACSQMEGSPKKLEPPLTGWRKRLRDGKEGDTIWVN